MRLIVVAVASPHVTERDEPTDALLIERSLEGDASAFEEIVRRHQKRIYRVALAILRDEAEADTVTQDTFVQGYLHLARFQRRAGLETWLTRIAINRARDVLRSRAWRNLGSRIGLAEASREAPLRLVEPGPDAERLAIGRELRAAIDRAVDGLSAQQKTIFRMRHDDGRPLEEIASLLGLRPGTVRAHLFRAIQRIRRELEPWAPGFSERGRI